MAKTNWMMVDLLEKQYPYSFRYLQELVMAMVDFQKNIGKKTLFGYDKGHKYYCKFRKSLKSTLLGLSEDGALHDIRDSSECCTQVIIALDYFALAFPNWQEAYGFAHVFFNKDEEPTLNFIDELWDY